MAKVLTSASNITCGHEGTVNTTRAAKLKIGDNPVLIKVGSSVSGCKTPNTNNTNPCDSATILGGQAAKLSVSSSPVMLDTVAGTTNGNPPGTIAVDAKQSKLQAKAILSVTP